MKIKVSFCIVCVSLCSINGSTSSKRSITSDKEYDRHEYDLLSPDGKTFHFDNYEQLRQVWFEQVRNWTGWKVDVIDKKQKKEKPKGF